MMSSSQHADFDPYSNESLQTVEIIEALPHSSAFEHVMYDNRLSRTVTYEFSHKGEDMTDRDPIIIEPGLMLSQFPEPLRDVFPMISYSIQQLEARQEESKEGTSFYLQFIANDIPHSVSINNGTATYVTMNESMEHVEYHFEPEVIIGLLAAFVYARQYDPLTPDTMIELAEATIHSPRDPRVGLVERLLMTLGDHSGRAIIETQSVFENESGSPIIALLKDQEFPDKSTTASTLLISEVNEINNLTPSVETTLYQNIVNVEQGTEILPTGQLTSRYAEQRSTVFTFPTIPTSEYIDPDLNYARWVRTCGTFLSIIKKPMSQYDYLDGSSILD